MRSMDFYDVEEVVRVWANDSGNTMAEVKLTHHLFFWKSKLHRVMFHAKIRYESSIDNPTWYWVHDGTSVNAAQEQIVNGHIRLQKVDLT